MVDPKKIESIRVVGMQKKKDLSSNKHYEFILRVKWSNKAEMTIYRPYSMFFDFQGVLCEMFKERYSITIPPVPGTKFHWILLGKLGIEKECKSMEEFCHKIVSLPSLVSQSMVVLHFFDAWGTDIRTLNQQTTELVGVSIGSPVIQSQGSSSQPQSSIATAPAADHEDQYRAIASFTATNAGEISFEEDSVVTVIEKTERGWWFVWNELDQQGWAPATYLEPIGAENEEDNDEWVVIDDTDHAHFYTTVVSYSAQNPDEISYESGEEVEVVAKSNYGWWKIRHGDKVGLSPATNLKKKDEEYTSPAELGRTMSISSKSGLYAVIRKAPPRKNSVRRSGNFNQKDISRFVYSATSFSGGKFVFDDKENNASFGSQQQKDEADAKTSRQNEQIVKRAQSCDEGLMSYENVDMNRKLSNTAKEDLIKGVKVKGIEWYSALADYTPNKDRADDLTLKKGDIMQLVAVDAGWFFVHLKRGSDVKDGWVPSTYVERNWDVSLEKLNISDHIGTGTTAPKPKPRPRTKQRDKAEDPTPPTTPPVPSRRNNTKPNFPEQAKVSPASSPVADRPRLPIPSATPVKSQEPPEVPVTSASNTPQVKQEESEMGESIYDEPEAQLRSVYDAEPWFFGKTSRQQCEQMLKQAGRQQEFLIRESTRGTGSYALSVKYCYRIRHFPIETSSDGQLLIGKLTFANLIDIVKYYRENPLFFSEHKEPITLGNPFKAPQR